MKPLRWVWKVQEGPVTIILAGGGVVGARCYFGSVEVANVDALAFYLDARHPALLPFGKVYTSIMRSASMLKSFCWTIDNGIFNVFGNFIKAGELAMLLYSSNVIGPGGFNFGRVATKMYRLAVGLDIDCPKVTILIPRDAFEPRRRIGVTTHIVHVLGACNQAEIAPAIINAVAINVIDFHALWYFHQKAMHQDVTLIFPPTNRGLGIAKVRNMPFVGHQHFIVFVIDNGEIATRQWNLFGHKLLLMMAVHLVMVVMTEGDEVVEVVRATFRSRADVMDADLFEAVFGAAGMLAGEVITDVGTHSLFLPAVGAAFTGAQGSNKNGEGVDDGTEFKGDRWDVEGIDGQGAGHIAGGHM